MQAGELDDLRDERVCDLEGLLPLAADVNCAVLRAAGPCATASGGAGSRRRRAAARGPGPIVDSWRLPASAASRRATAGSVMVTGGHVERRMHKGRCETAMILPGYLGPRPDVVQRVQLPRRRWRREEQAGRSVLWVVGKRSR